MCTLEKKITIKCQYLKCLSLCVVHRGYTQRTTFCLVTAAQIQMFSFIYLKQWLYICSNSPEQLWFHWVLSARILLCPEQSQGFFFCLKKDSSCLSPISLVPLVPKPQNWCYPEHLSPLRAKSRMQFYNLSWCWWFSRSSPLPSSGRYPCS